MVNNFTLISILLFIGSALYMTTTTNIFLLCSHGYTSSYDTITSKTEYDQLCNNLLLFKDEDSLTSSIVHLFFKLVISLEEKEQHVREAKFTEWLSELNRESFIIKITLLKYAMICFYIGLMYILLVTLAMYILRIIRNSVIYLMYLAFTVLALDFLIYCLNWKVDVGLIQNYVYGYIKMYTSVFKLLKKVIFA